MNNLGNCYLHGRGAAENFDLAVQWFSKAALDGYRQGQYHLAYMYEFGLGVPQDRALAIAWYEKAAAQGDRGATDAAKWLADPTNVSFRTAEERDAWMAKNAAHSSGGAGGGSSSGTQDSTRTDPYYQEAMQRCREAHDDVDNWREHANK